MAGGLKEVLLLQRFTSICFLPLFPKENTVTVSEGTLLSLFQCFIQLVRISNEKEIDRLNTRTSIPHRESQKIIVDALKYEEIMQLIDTLVQDTRLKRPK